MRLASGDWLEGKGLLRYSEGDGGGIISGITSGESVKGFCGALVRRGCKTETILGSSWGIVLLRLGMV